jgi:hypothetical protein
MRWALILLSLLCAGCVSLPHTTVSIATTQDNVDYRVDMEM